MKIAEYTDKSSRQWDIHRVWSPYPGPSVVWVAESLDGSGDSIEANTRELLERAIEELADGRG